MVCWGVIRVSRTRRSKPIDGGKETERESEQKKDMVVGGSEHPTNKSFVCFFVFGRARYHYRHSVSLLIRVPMSQSPPLLFLFVSAAT